MPPKGKYRANLLAAVGASLSKAEPSDAIRNPALDIVNAMDLDDDVPAQRRDLPSIATVLMPHDGFCNFCGHEARLLRTCHNCKAKVCEQPDGGAQGCVALGLGLSPNFECPHCARMNLRKEYMFLGYAGRTRSKIAWPLVVIHAAPAEGVHGYLRHALRADLENEFAVCPENLVTAHVTLKFGGSHVAASSLRPVVDFLLRASDSESPANSIVVIQTPSNFTTGALFYGNDDSRPAYSTLPDIVSSFLGTDVMEAMMASNAKACAATRVEQSGCFQEAMAARGGWRGLILVTQGPTIRSPPRLAEAIGMVKSGAFDFIIVFTGPAVDPAHARAFVFNIVRAIAIDNPVDANHAFPPSIWSAFTRAIKSAPAFLESSPVVIVCKERPPTGGDVVCRQVAQHAPPFNAWGVQFRSCGNDCTDVLPSDFKFRLDKGAVRCYCSLCGWKSCRLKHEDIADVVPILSPGLSDVFWHSYPPPAQLLDAFQRISTDRRK